MLRDSTTASSGAAPPQAQLDARVGSHGEQPSIIVRATVNPEDRDDLAATAAAPPPPSDATHTSESIAATSGGVDPAPHPRPQIRDPDRYQIIGEHGRGGLGRVSRAHDRDLGRDIAIKELLSRGNLHEVRFLREALITARLEHPGIVPVYEAGRWPDGTPFYAMKLVSGRPLRDLIAERSTVATRIGLLHHVIAVADAMAYAHGRNIIHRDLKPANIIVGEFGETIVIDWGLAKDLTQPDEPSSAGASYRGPTHDGLTATGSVLGTPAYMAPEQARGEHVDQRADVFAIGAMLWELCALERVPPTDLRARHRMLRRSGIDRDLAIIIDKALDSAPQRRYANAATLAADLKAFKSGVRIAARSYSLPAMLGHWTRQHRTLALSVATVIALAIVGSVFYVRGVAEERDLADASEQNAKRAQATAESTLGQFTLKHAELLLMTDPSAAIDVLAAHRDGEHGRADQIRAEAAGRGIALMRAKPHTELVRWATGRPDGSIISLSLDGTIVRTSLDHTSTVLARGVSPRGHFSYSPARGLLAYGCDPSDVCLWDVFRGSRIPLASAFREWQLAGLSFSPDGSKLALLSHSGLVRILDVSAPEQPTELLQLHRAHGIGILFVDNDTIAVGLEDSLAIELIRMNGETQTLTIHSRFVWEAIPNEHRIVLGTEHGEVIYIDDAPLRALNRVSICHGAVVAIKAVPGRDIIAYACKEGSIGTWNPKGHSTVQLTHLEGRADALAVSEAGDYVIAAGGNGAVVVFDLVANIVTSYRGHEFRLTSISAPTAGYPYFVSADQRGALRVWPLPNRIARVLENVGAPCASAIFNGSTDTTISTTYGADLVEFSPPGNLRAVTPHLASATYLESAGNGNTFAAYGSSESVELWSFQPLARQRVIRTGQGAVSRVAFIGTTDDFVTAGRDGRIIYWTANGEQRQSVKFDLPIANVLSANSAQYLIVNTADGALWRTDSSGHTAQLRRSDTRVIKMTTIPNSESVGIAYANGEFNVLNTNTWQQVSILHTAQAVRDIAFSRDGDTVAVADSNDIIHVGRRPGTSWATGSADNVIWTTFTARAGRLALTPDGLLIALCSDGTIWLYSSMHNAWICLPIGAAAPRIVIVTTDGKFAAVFDIEGRIVWLDLELARKSFIDMVTAH